MGGRGRGGARVGGGGGRGGPGVGAGGGGSGSGSTRVPRITPTRAGISPCPPSLRHRHTWPVTASVEVPQGGDQAREVHTTMRSPTPPLHGLEPTDASRQQGPRGAVRAAVSLDDERSCLDEPLQELTVDVGMVDRVPDRLPALVALPEEALVEQIEAMQPGHVLPPVGAGRPQRRRPHVSMQVPMPPRMSEGMGLQARHVAVGGQAEVRAPARRGRVRACACRR